MRLEGKVAIVTGGGRGIGRGIADRFAEEGALVTVLDREDPPEAFDKGQTLLKGDVVDPGVWDSLVADLVTEHGRIDVLVNNAGIIDYAPLHEVELENWDRVLAVNETAVMLGMRAVLGPMLERESGSIITISSIWGTIAAAGCASYHATKGAVRNLTKNVAITYAQQGIRANSIHPGIIETPLVAAQDKDVSAWVVAQTPMDRMGTPADIGNGAVYLASDEARYVTGIELPIDGGYTAQ